MSEKHIDIKFLEIRDKATFMPMFAFTTTSDLYEQDYLLRRAGYAPDSDLVVFGYLAQSGMPACHDPYDWNDRTKQVAHAYIQAHWHELKDGDVVDVEFILKESDQPKQSERIAI
jgi:hypothetical protein